MSSCPNQLWPKLLLPTGAVTVHPAAAQPLWCHPRPACYCLATTGGRQESIHSVCLQKGGRWEGKSKGSGKRCICDMTSILSLFVPLTLYSFRQHERFKGEFKTSLSPPSDSFSLGISWFFSHYFRKNSGKIKNPPGHWFIKRFTVN